MRLQATDPDLETLVARIEREDIDLQPDFQRGEIWSPAKKRKLIDSILRGWHVPPIHLVVREGGVQEVLDGQQRLAAIRDFCRNEFAIEGGIEPADPNISRLDGLRFRELPDDIRRRFNSFTVRTFLLTDYKPEEPGELFFRLNQVATLTSAEQRNAFYGAARDQVREVVSFVNDEIGEERLGFSNKRMAYDDVISKFLLHCERGHIAIKSSATDLSQRFRSGTAFSPEYVIDAKRVFSVIFSDFSGGDDGYRLNKASLLSWMLFVVRATHGYVPENTLSEFFGTFRSYVAGNQRRTSLAQDAQLTSSLARLFVDRASFRVSDISSVVARDFALWATFYLAGSNSLETPLGETDFASLVATVGVLRKTPELLDEDFDAIMTSLPGWGRLHAKS